MDLNDGWSLKLNTSPYTWDTNNESDITNDIIGPVFTEKLNSFHLLECKLRNTGKQYTYSGSDNFIMDNPRAYFTMGTKTMKMTVKNAHPNVSKDTVNVSLVSSTYDLKGAIAQIKVQPDTDGNYYVEDVIYKALFDTGMQNFFLIKLSDGTYYSRKTPPELKTRLDYDEDIVYTRVPVFDVLSDICAEGGCAWWESDLSSSDQYSVINIARVDTEFDVSKDKTINVSTYDNTTTIKPKKGFDTISNLIYFDKLPFFVAEHDSMDRYGIRSPKEVSFDEDSGSSDKYLSNAMKLRSVVKDPLVSFPITVKGLADIPSMDRFIKVVDRDYNYDNYSSIDRKYRINSIRYSIGTNETTITIGNEYRKLQSDKLSDLSKDNSNMSDSNEAQSIGKGPQDSELRLQIFTEGSDHSDDFTHDSGEYGVRMDIDYCYSNDSPNAKIYYEDDGIRTGN